MQFLKVLVQVASEKDARKHQRHMGIFVNSTRAVKARAFLFQVINDSTFLGEPVDWLSFSCGLLYTEAML
jgi:hypothetical protein